MKFSILFFGLLVACLAVWTAIVARTDVVSQVSPLAACMQKEALSDDACLKAYDNAVRQYRADYDRWSLNHRARSMTWQFMSGIISFFVVMAIIVAGVYMSYLEFTRNRESTTTLKFGGTGVEISSPVIGIIVLLISFLFTSTYLDKVYPIREVVPAGTTRGVAPSN